MTNIKTMMEEIAQEELERDGAACVEAMQKPNVELLQRDLEHMRGALARYRERYKAAQCEIELLKEENDRMQGFAREREKIEYELRRETDEVHRLEGLIADMDERAEGMKELHRETIRALYELIRD